MALKDEADLLAGIVEKRSVNKMEYASRKCADRAVEEVRRLEPQ